MTKKKILTLAMALSMVAILAIGGTIAYFTDTDNNTNTMTVGNVNIEQNEQQENEEGELEDFEQNQPLLPAPSDEYDSENHIDKIVTVTNAGTLPAYVRTILFFEDNAEGTITSQVHTLWGNVSGVDGLQQGEGMEPTSEYDIYWMLDGEDWVTVTKDGVTYTVAVATYPEALAVGATSTPSLMEVWLDDAATNDWSAAVGNEYTILALSQGVQVGDWTEPEVALNTAFGECTQENLQAWINTL